MSYANDRPSANRYVRMEQARHDRKTLGASGIGRRIGQREGARAANNRAPRIGSGDAQNGKQYYGAKGVAIAGRGSRQNCAMGGDGLYNGIDQRRPSFERRAHNQDIGDGAQNIRASKAAKLMSIGHVLKWLTFFLVMYALAAHAAAVVTVLSKGA